MSSTTVHRADCRRGRKRKLHPLIVRTAAQLFSDGGFEQTTVNQIAAAAGVTKTTLYIYFDGKAALIDLVLEQWLQELSAIRPRCQALPLRDQLVDVGHQLQELAASAAFVSLTRWLYEIEERLSPQQVITWRTRYEAFENYIAAMLERHCSCENPNRAALQFLRLAIGDLSLSTTLAHSNAAGQVEDAVDLLLRAYPERPIRES